MHVTVADGRDGHSGIVQEDRLYHRDPASRPLPQAPARGLMYALLLGAAGWLGIWGAVVLIRAWIA